MVGTKQILLLIRRLFSNPCSTTSRSEVTTKKSQPLREVTTMAIDATGQPLENQRVAASL
jgi:hypothetical protein